MASLHLENSEEDAIHDEASLSLPTTQVSHQTIQNGPLDSPALIPPLAAFPPVGHSSICLPYIPNFSSPLHSQDKIVIEAAATEPDIEVEEEKKPDKEHKKRSKNWTRPETLRLIRLRTELAPKFARTGRKSDLWDQIASTLRQENFNRDGQQCRDKWEKLMAGYKEVRDGLKDKEDYLFYEELHPLLSQRTVKKDKESMNDTETNEGGVAAKPSPQSASLNKEAEKERPSGRNDGLSDEDDNDVMENKFPHKRKRSSQYVTSTEIQAVHALLETVLSQQQKFFKDFLDALEQKDREREILRQERENRWRQEEQTRIREFNNAMVLLTQKLVEERVGGMACAPSVPAGSNQTNNTVSVKRSKNWKMTEVHQLIKLRREMDDKFSKSSRKAAVWEELSDILSRQGILRDGKQCREKWEKLTAEYKEVVDGKREANDSAYFQELMSVIGAKTGESE